MKLKTRGKAAQLGDELQQAIEGEVRFDKGSRALYATDASNYRQVPIGVVLPKSREDVLKTLEICRQFNAPVLSRGGGTSLAGQCCNVAVVLDFSKYLNRILDLDPHRRIAVVEPGVILDQLRDKAKEHGLTFGPDPSTHTHCTMGGMIGNNSCGVHSVMAGVTADNVEWLEIALYDGTVMKVGKTTPEELENAIRAGGRRGEVYTRLRDLRDQYAELVRERYPNIPRRVSGYNLDRLLPEHGFHVGQALVGSEGTLVTILSAGLRLVPWPKYRSLLVLGYPTIFRAADHVPEVMESGPIGLEAIDHLLVSDMRIKHIHLRDLDLLPKGRGFLLAEYGGDSREEADDKARKLVQKLQGASDAPDMKLVDDPKQEEKIWLIRESGLGATARIPGMADTWEGWEDSAVPPEKLGEYLRRLEDLYDKHGYRASLYGHFGQGCVHTRIDYDLTTEKGIKDFRNFIDEASDLVLELGGSLSGEHGDGQSRAALLPKMFGPEIITAFEKLKAIFDPGNRMNPGKVVHPYQPTDNLRLGPHNYHPHPVKTQFTYPEEEGSFKRATQRCVGVGNCRQHDGGVMCPSYQATLEEKHSTRGRARLLFEMLEGEVIEGGWKDPSVRESLDLCLACKGCKGECPVSVDMATYKAEFLSHYYKGRLRPRSAYAMGLIPWWARLASLAPNLANAVSHLPVSAQLFKLAGGISQKRQVPRFATRTFQSWFRGRTPGGPAPNGKVTLWADTFTNFFHPEIGQAAVSVLESAGFQVVLSPDGLCCGRPLYDYGMLDLARHQLERNVSALQEGIEEHRPLVALEPSCLAVFQDEMCNLLGRHDGRALRLKATSYSLAAFLKERAPKWQPPRYHSQALFHGHCHQSALTGFEADLDLLENAGVQVHRPDEGCCGMAGSFGFEREHYAISQAIGERALLPAVRKSPGLLIADGFSCRTQIAQASGRKPLHLAQVLAGLEPDIH